MLCLECQDTEITQIQAVPDVYTFTFYKSDTKNHLRCRTWGILHQQTWIGQKLRIRLIMSWGGATVSDSKNVCSHCLWLSRPWVTRTGLGTPECLCVCVCVCMRTCVGIVREAFSETHLKGTQTWGLLSLAKERMNRRWSLASCLGNGQRGLYSKWYRTSSAELLGSFMSDKETTKPNKELRLMVGKPPLL